MIIVGIVFALMFFSSELGRVFFFTGARWLLEKTSSLVKNGIAFIVVAVIIKMYLRKH